MKVAIVHDWFNNVGGAEKVVKEILECFPEADLFCLFDYFPREEREKLLHGKDTRVSVLQYIPFARRLYRFMFPMFPAGMRSLSVKGYDLVISSSSCAAKGIKTGKDQLHICYCHSPVRYAWQLRQEYLEVIKYRYLQQILELFLVRLRKWDVKNTSGVDYFIANSRYIAERIRLNYHRESTVIYPPVSVDSFVPVTSKQGYYFTVSRLVTYKHIEVLVRAFASLPHLMLVIGGNGPMNKSLRKMATPNVKFTGYLSDKDLQTKMQNAKALIVGANEDFGITVVEAQSCATPVIVPAIGGYLETVTDKTGMFYEYRDVGSLVECILRFESGSGWNDPEVFRRHVHSFGIERFRQEFYTFVMEKYRSRFGA
ncbi:MAG: glycosyltransferase [Eubacteriales bacterium]|nr:glycosyltransferase [Eubacteriales bacterium]